MKKLIFLFLLACIGGFAYAPFQATDRYAAAVAAHDPKAVLALTDVVAYRESLKEALRPALSDYIRLMAPVNQPSAKTQADTVSGTLFFEKQLDLLVSAENPEKFLNATHDQSEKNDFVFLNRGWRSPLVFVAVDNRSETKRIFEFQGLAGWKLTKIEASRDMLRKECERLLKMVRK